MNARLPAALLALAVCLPVAAWADDPCGGLSLDAGRVASARVLRAVEKASPAEAACAAAIGQALGARAGVRSVTVAVRLSDAERAAGAGLRIGERFKSALAEGGVPAARISVVVPRVPEGQQGTVAISFTEKRAERAVAVIESMGGTVTAGGDRSKLAPVARGAQLDPETWVATGAGSTAWIGLADGSRLRLSENSLLFVGRLHLDDKLERVVRLKLVSGDLEAQVRSGGASSVFDISTRFGTAGVRGTRFRLSAGEGGTRLETLEGSVALAGTDAQPALVIAGGQGATLGRQGEAAPAPLPGAPTATAPLEGPLKAGGALAWQAVEGAKGYTVDLSRDAEFTYDVRHLESAQPTLALDAGTEAGKWYWRVAAVGADGFVGPTSKVYAFDLKR